MDYTRKKFTNLRIGHTSTTSTTKVAHKKG